MRSAAASFQETLTGAQHVLVAASQPDRFSKLQRERCRVTEIYQRLERTNKDTSSTYNPRTPAGQKLFDASVKRTMVLLTGRPELAEHVHGPFRFNSLAAAITAWMLYSGALCRTASFQTLSMTAPQVSSFEEANLFDLRKSCEQPNALRTELDSALTQKTSKLLKDTIWNEYQRQRTRVMFTSRVGVG